MLEKITETNRAIIINSSMIPDSVSSVHLKYDRFDRIIFVSDENGLDFLPDGSLYDPLPLPGSNNISTVTFEYNGGSSVEVVCELHMWPQYINTEYLTVTNDQTGLNFTGFTITPNNSYFSNNFVINFDGVVDNGTTINISGILFNQAFAPTNLNNDYTKD